MDALIDQRLEAFCKRDFLKYPHFKQKVKKEIINAKKILLKKATKTNVWKFVQPSSGKNHIENLSQLYARFPNMKIAADVIDYIHVQLLRKSPRE